MSLTNRLIVILGIVACQAICFSFAAHGDVGFMTCVFLNITAVGLTAAGCCLMAGYYEHRLSDTVNDLSFTVEQKSRSLMNTRNAVIFGMAKLAESRDTDTGDHLDRIRFYSTILAERMMPNHADIDEGFVKYIGLASALHDIGKVGIPDNVLLKPGKLNAEERKIIEQHPEIGGNCLSAIMNQLGEDDFLSLAREITFYHHEKWDGSGYPYQLSGDCIPISARIVAVADVYDALRSKRPYKDEMSHEKTCKIIYEGRGTHFDPSVVDAFRELEEEFHLYSMASLKQDLPTSDDAFPSFAEPLAPAVDSMTPAGLPLTTSP